MCKDIEPIEYGMLNDHGTKAWKYTYAHHCSYARFGFGLKQICLTTWTVDNANVSMPESCHARPHIAVMNMRISSRNSLLSMATSRNSLLSMATRRNSLLSMFKSQLFTIDCHAAVLYYRWSPELSWVNPKCTDAPGHQHVHKRYVCVLRIVMFLIVCNFQKMVMLVHISL